MHANDIYFLVFFAVAFFLGLNSESFVTSSESFSLASSSETSSITSSTYQRNQHVKKINQVSQILTYASSRSGAGPPASFFGILPRSWALWKGIGCSDA